MKIKVICFVILVIIISNHTVFSQTYKETIENGFDELYSENYNVAIGIFNDGLNLDEVRLDPKKKSNLYFNIALCKYRMNDEDFINDVTNSLIIYNENGNAHFLKSIYYNNKGNNRLMNQYLKRSLELENFTPKIFSKEMDVLLKDEKYIELFKEMKPELLGYNSNSYIIKKYVENKINQWQKKGKYEKTDDYIERVNEVSRNKMIELLTQDAIDSIANGKIKLNYKFVEYDADNESFKILFTNNTSIIVNVPIDEAPSFDKNFSRIIQSNKKFTLNKNDEFTLFHLELINPENNKSYIYDSKDDVAFSSTKLKLQFDEIEISLPNNLAENKQNTNGVNEIFVGKSDVDINIPETKIIKKNTYLLAIGNEDYTKYQNDLKSESNVLYAKNDAITFTKYAEKTLGIPKENITLINDAISSQIKREIIRLINKAKYGNGEIEIIFYFSGHGFPDLETQEAYIMPVDINSSSVKDGIKLSQLYNDLAEFPTKRVTVILDACFSGGGRTQGLLAAKAVRIKPKEETLNKGNLIVFSASSGDQASLFYNEKQHGIFTYFLLKKLQESKGKITYGEMADYLIKIVPLTSSDINYKEQNPQVNVGKDVINSWELLEF